MAVTIPKSAIREYDKVSFAEPVEKFEGTGQWPAGTIGVVVMDHGSHKTVEVENARGETLDLPVVPIEKLKLVAMCGYRPQPDWLSESA